MPNTTKNTASTTVTSEPAINDSDMEFHTGQLDGSEREANRIKKAMDERYKKLVDMFNKEVNIATRYELKLRIDELQETYNMLFVEGGN